MTRELRFLITNYTFRVLFPGNYCRNLLNEEGKEQDTDFYGVVEKSSVWLTHCPKIWPNNKTLNYGKSNPKFSASPLNTLFILHNIHCVNCSFIIQIHIKQRENKEMYLPNFHTLIIKCLFKYVKINFRQRKTEFSFLIITITNIVFLLYCFGGFIYFFVY